MNEWLQYEKLFNPFGEYVIEIDTATNSGHDVRFVCLRLEICDRKLIHKSHLVPYKSPSAKRCLYNLDTEIETDKAESLSAWARRKDR